MQTDQPSTIRREIISRGYIKAIIGLPANLFYGTGIPACIIVLDKENASARKGIFMIDASKAFIKDGNKKPQTPRACAASPRAAMVPGRELRVECLGFVADAEFGATRKKI